MSRCADSLCFFLGVPRAGDESRRILTGCPPRRAGSTEPTTALERCGKQMDTRAGHTHGTSIERPIAVTVTDRASMERRLDEAVTVLRSLAIHEGRRGILVTRHDYGSFTVDLSDAVPFGLTHEHQDW